MADTRKIVKVFLASPGDLEGERRKAKSVVDEFNKLWADRLGYHVELVGWEDTVGGYGRPQELINQDLERCELFIGMMFKRWGTPPGGSGAYTSGFEEEYETSIERRRNTGKPEVNILFKAIDPDAARDAGPELSKVIAFKEKIKTEKILLYEEFAEIDQFEAKFRACITTYVHRLEDQEARDASRQTQSAPQEGFSTLSAAQSESPAESPLSTEGAKFLRDFITKTEQQPDAEIDPAEVARFRLLGSIMGREGNDEHSLNAHDANLIFVDPSNPALSRREIFGLIDCGLENFGNQNTPLWRWYAAASGFTDHLFSLLSFYGTAAQRTGALQAMRLISDPIRGEPKREDYIQNWLSEDSPSGFKVAALGYLADCGVTQDLEQITKEFDKGSYQTSGAAVDAILRINLRDSRDKAIAALYKLQPESVRDDLVEEIFGDGKALKLELLSQGATHRSPAVRRTCVRLLAKRDALTLELAQQLLSDSDAEIRFTALKALIKSGKAYSDDEAKGILVKPVYAGLLAVAAGPQDPAGEDCLKRHRRDRMLAIPLQELTNAAESDSVIDRDAFFALVERDFRSRADELRALLDDGFKSDFTRRLDEMARRIGTEHELVKKIKALEEHLTRQFTRQGLDILCQKGSPQDLNRVRGALRGGSVSYSDVDIEYLRRFGEWEDIPLIIESVKRPAYGVSLLGSYDERKYRLAARAVLEIGKARLEEVFSLGDVPSALLTFLILEMPDKYVRQLSANTLATLLHAKAADVRKAMALRCVCSLPKARLKAILGVYISGDTPPFYNVIHWLDLGTSAPKDVARRAAKKVIDTDWR